MDENEKSGFFKSNLDGISKLFVYHIAMCVFGIVVVLAVQMITEHITGDRDMPLGIPAYIAAGFAVIVYCGLIYVAMWEKGASDKIKIDGGRQKKNIAKPKELIVMPHEPMTGVHVGPCVLTLFYEGNRR